MTTMKEHNQEASYYFFEFNGFEESSSSCYPVKRVFIEQIVVNQGYSSGSEDFLFYHFYDALGNIVAIIDDSGNITLYEQDAFGNRIPGSSGSGTCLLYRCMNCISGGHDDLLQYANAVLKGRGISPGSAAYEQERSKWAHETRDICMPECGDAVRELLLAAWDSFLAVTPL